LTEAVSRGRGRRAGLDVKLGRSAMALAYEMQQDGIRMGLLAKHLGVNANHLHTLINRCKREGLGWLRKP
jgi:hypothetical protein